MDIGNIGSVYTDLYAQQAADQSASRLEAQLQGDHTDASDDELMDVCKQFEAYFLEQIFKGMMKTVPESESASQANSTLMDYYKDEMVRDRGGATADWIPTVLHRRSLRPAGRHSSLERYSRHRMPGTDGTGHPVKHANRFSSFGQSGDSSTPFFRERCVRHT